MPMLVKFIEYMSQKELELHEGFLLISVIRAY